MCHGEESAIYGWLSSEAVCPVSNPLRSAVIDIEAHAPFCVHGALYSSAAP